ncbi:MAG: hypothetical protein ACREL5_14865 [Gemmatimonadales bacterium]
MSIRRIAGAFLFLAFAACNHSGTAPTVASSVGPSGTGSDVQLTFNVDQDYWPAWTEDAHGILYGFVRPGSANHRCLGLLPAAGGTRRWQMCDDRTSQDDTVSSFGAYALRSDGRLLYTEAVSPASAASTPERITLWLADSAAPFNRTELLTMPTFIGGAALGWLSDIAWTGDNAFVALGQQLSFLAHCFGCTALDTLFADSGYVVTGTIAGGKATLHVVDGTLDATSYSLAQAGSSIVFTRKNDVHLFAVPVTGGAPVVVGTVTDAGGSQLLGVSCAGDTCVVAVDAVSLSDPDLPSFPRLGSGPRELRSVSLTSGQAEVLRTVPSLFATPRIAPDGHDVVAQVGGNWGHLQTFAGSGDATLFLYRALVP